MAGADLTLTTSANLDGAIRDINRLPSAIKPVNLKFEGGLALGKITGQVSEFQKSLAASNARVLAFSASAGQLYTYVRVFDSILKSTIEVQKSLVNLNVIFGLSSRQLDTFASSLFKVASETGQSFKTASEAALEFSRQGLGVEETLKRTRDALTLTRLTGLEVAESIRTLTTVINGFNEAGLDSTTIINKLTAVDTSFAISAGDIAQALTRVGSIAKDTGVSFDKLLGLITAARVTTGREGSVIATSLGTIFQRIERPQVLQQLKELRVVTEDANGENLTADKILQNLAKSYTGLEQSQKNQVIQFAGGVRQGNVLRALLADLAKENSVYEKATQASANATDVATKRQVALNKTLSAQINETVNNFTQAAYRIGTITLTPSITRVLGIGNFFTKGINSDLNQQGQDAGQFLGAGLLKGIGNYLSGPGLALGAAVITRFFTNFIGFASKSLTQLLEIGSERYSREQAIEQVLQREPGLLAELNRLGSDNVLIQARITQELEKQLTLQNAKATVSNAIYSGIQGNLGKVESSLGIASEEKAFRINNKGDLSINRASGFVPKIKETLGALQAGYNPGQVRDLNINGIGKVTYNTAETVKNFPGLSQPAILPPSSSKAGGNYKKSFEGIHGFNPYGAAGIVPSRNAADGFFADIKSPFKDPFNRPPGDINISNTVNDFLNTILKPSIKKGSQSFFDLSSQVQGFSKEMNLTTESAKKLNEIFVKSFTYYNGPQLNPKLLTNSQAKSPLLLPPPSTDLSKIEILRQNDKQYAPNSIEANVTRLTRGLQNENQRSPFLDENLEKRRVLTTPYPPFEQERSRRYYSSINQDNYATTRNNVLKNIDFSALDASGLYKALVKNLETEAKKEAGKTQAFLSGTDIKPGEYGPSDSRFRYSQSIERIKQQPLADLQTRQSQFSDKLNNNFGLGSLLNPFKYNSFKNEATQNQQLGSFRNRTSELQNKAFLASFITPIIAGVVQQGISTTDFGKNTLSGRGTSQLIGGLGNVGSFALTGAGVAGPYGALAGAGIGIATELPSIIKAFTDTLPDLQANLERIKDSTQKTTRGLEDFARISSQLSDIYSGESAATKGQEKTLLAQRNLALSQLSPDTRAKLNEATKAGDQGKIGEIVGNVSSVAKQQQAAHEDLLLLKQSVDKNQGSFLGNLLKDSLNNTSARYHAGGGGTGFLGAIGGSLNVLNPLSGLSPDVKAEYRGNKEFEAATGNKDLHDITKPFLQEILGFQNSEGKNLFEQLTPKDIDRIQGTKGDEKVNVLSSVLGQHGILGNDLPRFIEDLKKTFSTPESKNVLNKDIDQVFNQKTLTNITENAKDVETGTAKIAKAFSDFSNKLINSQEKLTKFADNIEKSSIVRLSLTSGNLRSNEIIQKTSNQLSLAKSGNNPFLANQFQFEESKQRIQNELTIGLQKNSGDTKGKIAETFNTIVNSQFSRIQQGVLTKKESGNISPEEEKKAEEQLEVFGKLFNNPQYLKIKELLQNPTKNLSTQDINKINSFIGSQLNVLDEFRQTGQVTEDKINTVAKGLGISPEDVKKIFNDRADLFNEYEKGFQSLKKISDNATKQDLQLRGSIFEQNKINSTQFEQNKRLIAPTVAFSSDQQKILGSINENAARTGDGKNINFGQTFASGFQYNQAQFFNDLSKNTQDFGKEFKDAFGGAFAEAENSSKKFTDILRDRFLSLAQNLTTKFVGQGLDALFGGTIGKLAPTFSDALQGKSSGGLIKGYSNGGFVDMGSGMKDDVPAMLTGGEYVLTKHAVNSIGVDNLDKLNSSQDSDKSLYNSVEQNGIKVGYKLSGVGGGSSSSSSAQRYSPLIHSVANALRIGGRVNKYASGDLVGFQQPNQYSYKYGKKNPTTYAGATLTDSISSTATSANINLANAYSLTNKGGAQRKGQFDVSPLLSTYGATDANNPQNQLKFAREKFVSNTDIANTKISKERSAFETNQLISLGAAYVSAGTQAAGANYGNINAPTTAQIAKIQGPTIDTTDSSYLNSVSSTNFSARGGQIRKMANGGMFGGDASSDRTPAMLMGGEYVVKPSVVSKYGANYFNNLNKKYAAGGYVGGSSYGGNNDYSKLLSDQFQKSLDVLQEISSKLGSNNSTSNIQSANNSKTNVSNPNGANANSTGVTNNVTVNITMSSTNGGASANGDNSSTSNSQSQSDKNTAKQLGDLVQTQMMTLLINQSKSGGILFERFEPRAR